MICDKFKVVINMNDEMFRLSLIDFMNGNLLNEFVNKVFNYRLKEGQYIYMQYKIVLNNIVLNIYDKRSDNKFNAYIFTNDSIEKENKNIHYINIDEAYIKYKNENTKNKLLLLGALLKSNDNYEKANIINYIDNDGIKNILLKHFTV